MFFFEHAQIFSYTLNLQKSTRCSKIGRSRKSRHKVTCCCRILLQFCPGLQEFSCSPLSRRFTWDLSIKTMFSSPSNGAASSCHAGNMIKLGLVSDSTCVSFSDLFMFDLFDNFQKPTE